MIDPSPRLVVPRRLTNSVFVKIFVTMLSMTLVIVLIISGFFFLVIAPTVGRAVDRVASEYVQLLASDAPDLETSRRIASRLEVDVRYEGPRGSWSTDPQLPSVEEARRTEQQAAYHHAVGRPYHVVTSAEGGSYLFAWRYHRSLHAIHNRILLALLACVVVVVLIAHGILRRAVQPLEWLHRGFARLSDGDLAVSVDHQRNDEFGDLANAFNHMAERVRQMVRERDQLLLDVSHELRSPLTRMKVALALSGEDEQKARLLSNVAEMETMVNELLELERLRQGHGIHPEPCDIVELVQDATQSMASKPPGIRLNPLPAPLVLRVDPQRLRTVLNNVLENAFKYSLSDSQPISISVDRGEAFVEIRIEDDGPGIPEPDLGHVFEPFYRVDRSRSRKTGGYGLGLSLCQRILLAHGGTIDVANRAPRGTCVRLRLPHATVE